MNEQLNQLVRFVNADARRFMEIQYAPIEDGWSVAICLGERPYRGPGVRAVASTRWLEAKDESYQKTLQLAVDQLATLRLRGKAVG